MNQMRFERWMRAVDDRLLEEAAQPLPKKLRLPKLPPPLLKKPLMKMRLEKSPRFRVIKSSPFGIKKFGTNTIGRESGENLASSA